MKRPCLGTPGRPCRALTTGTRCPSCTRANWRARNHARAGSLETRVYASVAYRNARAIVMAGATRCAWCGAEGVRLVAGHRYPIAERPDLATVPEGLAPTCASCNEREKHRRSRP